MLRLGCDYNILIETSNRDHTVSTNYSVNGKLILSHIISFIIEHFLYSDCINGICSCYYEFSLPKVDKFSAEFNKLATELHVSFSYDNIPINNYYHNTRILNATSLNAIRLRFALLHLFFICFA